LFVWRRFVAGRTPGAFELDSRLCGSDNRFVAYIRPNTSCSDYSGLLRAILTSHQTNKAKKPAIPNTKSIPKNALIPGILSSFLYFILKVKEKIRPGISA